MFSGLGDRMRLSLATLLFLAVPAAGSAQDAWVPMAQAPVGQVAGTTVTHPISPTLRVGVPENAVYVGSDRFILKALTDCEMHVFVEADAQRHVRRFYWVHFETYLPTRPESRFTYGEIDQRTELWGAAGWVRAQPAQMARIPAAGSDTEHYRNLIKRAGYIMPPELMTVRLVRLLDDPKGTGYGREELMLVYGEDMAPSKVKAEEVMTDGKTNARWRDFEPALIERGVASFRVTHR